MKIFFNTFSFLFLLILWSGLSYHLYMFTFHGSMDLFKGDVISFQQMLPFLTVAIPVVLFCSVKIVKQLFKIHSWRRHWIFLLSAAGLLCLYAVTFLFYACHVI